MTHTPATARDPPTGAGATVTSVTRLALLLRLAALPLATAAAPWSLTGRVVSVHKTP